jgi:ribonuclease VapC
VIVAVDASALVAIALQEPEREAMEACLLAADNAFVTPINLAEAGLALVLRDGRFTPEQYYRWLSALHITETGIDGAAALRAYLQYGKGVHRARLNLGDCYAYALAKAIDAPLLYKGHDFAFTDVRSALQPT